MVQDAHLNTYLMDWKDNRKRKRFKILWTSILIAEIVIAVVVLSVYAVTGAMNDIMITMLGLAAFPPLLVLAGFISLRSIPVRAGVSSEGIAVEYTKAMPDLILTGERWGNIEYLSPETYMGSELRSKKVIKVRLRNGQTRLITNIGPELDRFILEGYLKHGKKWADGGGGMRTGTTLIEGVR